MQLKLPLLGEYNKNIFFLLCGIFSCLCTILFYFQCIKIDSAYASDMPAHIELALFPNKDVGAYSFFHKFLIAIASVIGFMHASRYYTYLILMVLILGGSVFYSMVLLRNYFIKNYPDVNPYFLDLLALTLMLVSMLIINPGDPGKLYLGTGTPNPWHNPTYIFCKPFSIIVFFSLIKSFNNNHQNINYTQPLVQVFIFSILSMWTKPSFLMSFLPAIAILLLYKYIIKEISFRYLLHTGFALIPSLVPFLMINNHVYENAGNLDKVVLTFGKTWAYYSDNIVLSIILAAAFPLFVLVLNFRRPGFPLTLTAINFLIAAAIYFFITESGPRMLHNNFAWGYMFAIFFMFLAASEYFFLNKKTFHPVFKIAGSALFILHLVSGSYYFFILLRGDYYG